MYNPIFLVYRTNLLFSKASAIQQHKTALKAILRVE